MENEISSSPDERGDVYQQTADEAGTRSSVGISRENEVGDFHLGTGSSYFHFGVTTLDEYYLVCV